MEDHVDWGYQSIEALYLLLYFKIRCPQEFFWLKEIMNNQQKFTQLYGFSFLAVLNTFSLNSGLDL